MNQNNKQPASGTTERLLLRKQERHQLLNLVVDNQPQAALVT
jgi:hypothetical protein